MADSKWTDLWAIANWTDEDQAVLLSHVWPDLKAAADERVAFIEMSHDSGFSANDTFPDFNEDKSVFIQGIGTKNSVKINNSTFSGSWFNNDEIVDGGTVTVIGDIPDALTIGEALIEVGYAGATEYDHMTDTDDGDQPALPLSSWYVQWYKVMNYLTWTNRDIVISSSWITDIDFQYTSQTVIYGYNQDTSSFNSAQAPFREPNNSSPTDKYIANDLKESAPFSTPQEVRDYAISTFNANEGVTWNTGAAGQTVRIGLRHNEDISVDDTGNVGINCEVERQRIRFKIAQDFRATSPNRYDSEVYIYGFYTDNSIFTGSAAGTYSEFGTGFAEDDKELIKLIPDGSGWYVVEVPSADYDTEAVLSIPAQPDPGDPDNTADQNFTMTRRYITPDMADLDTDDASAWVKPNLTDGTGFEYYTPAP